MLVGMIDRRQESRRRAASLLGALLIHVGAFAGLAVGTPPVPVAERGLNADAGVVNVALVRAAPAARPNPEPSDAPRPEAALRGGGLEASGDRSGRPLAALASKAQGPGEHGADGARAQPAAPLALGAGDAVRTDYQRRLMAHIEAFKHYPPGEPGAHGVVELVFEIDRRGGVLGVWVVKSSGERGLDLAAVETVRRADPVPAIPDQLPALLTVPLSVSFDEQS
jgi:protein TonB